MQNSGKAISVQYCSTPCGELVLGAVDEQLCLCYWTNSLAYIHVQRRLQDWSGGTFAEEESDLLNLVKEQLREYFSGNLRYFTLPKLLIGTDFQKKVWYGVSQIPYGTTCSYKELACLCQLPPQSARAIAQALSVNPLQIIIPCHRVIRENGELSGYAGGKVAKQFLLSNEKTERFF